MNAFVDPVKAKPREKLFKFLKGHDGWLCKLVDFSQWDVEAQFLAERGISSLAQIRSFGA